LLLHKNVFFLFFFFVFRDSARALKRCVGVTGAQLSVVQK
jgi:hypothetical protein